MTIEPHTTPPVQPVSRVPDDEISLWEVLAVLVRRRFTIVITTIAFLGLAIAATLLSPDSYTTWATFRPQGSEASASQLTALANQFGVNVPGTGGDEASPAFYAELLTSREILWRLSGETFDVAGVGQTTLTDLFEVEAETEALRREEILEWLLDDALTVTTAVETGTVTLSLRTEWPDLSRTLAARLLQEVTLFNMDTRQSQAAAERKFIAARVDSARAELLRAESELQSFLESNRQWTGAPLLVFQQERLQREVTLKSAVLTTLVQSYEQARIQEVRDTPLITVSQAPFFPSGPDERRLDLAVALGIILGGMAGIVLAFVVEAVRSPTDGNRGREDFQESWRGLLRSIPLVGRRWA